MKEKNGKIEREIRIWKYKDGEAGGNVLRYTLESGKIKIENKKRIY